MRKGFEQLVSAVALAVALTATPALTPHAQAVVAVQGLPDVADLVDKLLPAVVEISVQSKNPDAPDTATQPESNPFKDFFDDFLKRKQQQGQLDENNKDAPAPDKKDDGSKDPTNKDKPPESRGNGNVVNSMGSGFIIDPKGLIVTNNHVIADAVNIQVHLQDGTMLKADLVGHDPKTDIAVIRVKPDHDLPSVAFGDSDKARIGQWVIAIGNPFGLGGSVSLGILSALNRDISAGPYDDYLQTDAAINKGNSGGPLFNLQGEVVGINTAIFSPTGGSVGIGFSVPANEAKNVAAQLIKFGEIRRGWLGVKLQTLTPDVAEGLGVQKSKGALIADVTADGPSDKAGIKAGDVVTNFDGRAIEDNRTLRRVVAETEVGKEVAVTIIRNGKEQTIKVTLGRLEEGEKQAAAADQKKKDVPVAPVQVMGLSLSDLTDELRTKFKIAKDVNGAVITDVAGDSTAADIGLSAGDVIKEAGNMPVKSAQDVQSAVDQANADKKKSVMLLVAHAGSAQDTRFVALKLKK